MSVHQVIAWYEAKMRLRGERNLDQLQILIAPNEERQFYRVRDRMLELAQGVKRNG